MGPNPDPVSLPIPFQYGFAMTGEKEKAEKVADAEMLD
jgi:hypothetical protein